ncbi:hypothetical protein GQ597_01795 [Gilliamella sp. Pra-s65]|uniref:hypothetical protein n=1 Tax=unclassified Gilliamella TaxID=2685620 RepID=UPI001366386C|nr:MULTISPECIES: hypothetical protein [unclassified Gilliamella]MWN89448.1 hypothetical protein [Gilliamella sp. Pra-s65]MWP74129.1 hypothetical protein [Gilliamella sp. Pra-s52]
MANISLDAINTINTRLGQTNAISTLLIADCDSNTPINEELRAYAFDAVSDLINDSKKLFRSETERRGLQDENQ